MGTKHSRLTFNERRFRSFLTRFTSLSLSSIVEGFGEERGGLFGVKRVLRFQIGKNGTKERNVVRIDERMSLSLSFVLLSKYNAKRFKKIDESRSQCTIRIVQMFAFKSKGDKRSIVDFSEE